MFRFARHRASRYRWGVSDTDPLIGQRVNNHVISRRIGAGGMGVIYHGFHETLGTEVAIKFLAGELATNEDFVARFLREARAAAMLDHPNIIRVHDAGLSDGVYYMIMEFVDGMNLAQLLRERKILSEDEMLGYAHTAALALGYAHQQGVIHRDIKPENLMVSGDGVLKVADLGLAKMVDDKDSTLTATGTAMGTPYYISPEQVRGDKNVDRRTDIYSLGATMFHLATGQVPFQGGSSGEIMAKHLTETPPLPRAVNPKLSDDYCRMHYMMMAKDRNDRYRTMEELAAAIEKTRGKGSGRMAMLNITGAPARMAALNIPSANDPKPKLKLRTRDDPPPQPQRAVMLHPAMAPPPPTPPPQIDADPILAHARAAAEQAPRSSLLGSINREVNEWCAGRNWIVRMPAWLYLLYVGIWNGVAPSYPSLILGLDAMIHQWGHQLTAPFNTNLHFAGGSILQLLVPLGLMVVCGFIKRYFGYSMMMAWCGISLANVGAYMADARRLQLAVALAGDDMDNDRGAGGHDWQWLFVKMGLTAYEKIGHSVSALGHVIFALGMLLGSWLLIQMMRAESKGA